MVGLVHLASGINLVVLMAEVMPTSAAAAVIINGPLHKSLGWILWEK